MQRGEKSKMIYWGRKSLYCILQNLHILATSFLFHFLITLENNLVVWGMLKIIFSRFNMLIISFYNLLYLFISLKNCPKDFDFSEYCKTSLFSLQRQCLEWILEVQYKWKIYTNRGKVRVKKIKLIKLNTKLWAWSYI